MGIVIIVVGLVFLLKKNIKNLLIVYIFSFIGIPANNFMNNILKMDFGIIDIRLILATFLLYLVFQNFISGKKLVLQRQDLIFLGLFALVIIYIGVGFFQKNPLLSLDINFLISIFIVYITLRVSVNDSISLKLVINSVLLSSIIYAIIIIFIYFFLQDYLLLIYGEQLFTWWGRRVNFTNHSIFIFTIPIAIYYLYTEDKKFIYLSYLFLSLSAVFISQTRTLIVVIIINILITLLLIWFFKLKDRSVNYLSVAVLFLTTSLFLFFSYLITALSLGVNSSLISDLIQRFNSDGDTLNVRSISNNIAYEKIKDNIFGYGFGEEVVLYNTDNSIANVGLYIDNAFISLGVKMGFAGIIILLLILVGIWINFLIIAKKTKQRIILILAISYPGFILMTAVMNAQVIYSSVVSFFVLLVYISSNNLKSISQEIK